MLLAPLRQKEIDGKLEGTRIFLSHPGFKIDDVYGIVWKVFQPIDLSAEDDVICLREPEVREIHFDFNGKARQRAGMIDNALDHRFAAGFVRAFGLFVGKSPANSAYFLPNMIEPHCQRFPEALFRREV